MKRHRVDMVDYEVPFPGELRNYTPLTEKIKKIFSF